MRVESNSFPAVIEPRFSEHISGEQYNPSIPYQQVQRHSMRHDMSYGQNTISSQFDMNSDMQVSLANILLTLF